MTQLYDTIGKNYNGVRRPEPYWSDQIHSHVGYAERVVNVGAGTGSYEPSSRRTVAVEPSFTMIKQRAVGTAPAVQAVAEALPFSDQVFSVAMAVLSSHHWESRAAAFEEIGRVAARKAVFVTWDPDHEDFWLTQDYFPEIVAIDREIFPPISEFRAAFGAIDVSSLLDPHDCIDGFLGAYWRRPHAYLSSTVRAGMSTFSKISNIDSGLKRLRMDLVSGEWSRRYKHLASKDFVDLGYRIVAAKIH